MKAKLAMEMLDQALELDFQRLQLMLQPMLHPQFKLGLEMILKLLTLLHLLGNKNVMQDLKLKLKPLGLKKKQRMLKSKLDMMHLRKALLKI
jgi:hypothetical protein|tara:strand:+ start:1307 stop:1582 length:276 start_codon:yes stop_codon:yes gene_type:complete